VSSPDADLSLTTYSQIATSTNNGTLIVVV
jgi:hypothetical protein